MRKREKKTHVKEEAMKSYVKNNLIKIINNLFLILSVFGMLIMLFITSGALAFADDGASSTDDVLEATVRYIVMEPIYMSKSAKTSYLIIDDTQSALSKSYRGVLTKQFLSRFSGEKNMHVENNSLVVLNSAAKPQDKTTRSITLMVNWLKMTSTTAAEVNIDYDSHNGTTYRLIKENGKWKVLKEIPDGNNY